MNSKSIAFDFDGTLVQGGYDKAIHMMVAAWIACHECGFEAFIHASDLASDVERLLGAVLAHPGTPRFRQLAAMVNALVNDTTAPFEDPDSIGVSAAAAQRYGDVKERFNQVYNDINNAAAARFWKPFPSVKSTLALLAAPYDLYVASGVVQDILCEDLTHHEFDLTLFVGVHGDDKTGRVDKGELLRRIKAKGYDDVLFVGNANMDLQFALEAGVKFFRIRDDSDWARLREALADDRFPHEPQGWDFEPEEIDFFRSKALHVLSAYAAGRPMTPEAITEHICG